MPRKAKTKIKYECQVIFPHICDKIAVLQVELMEEPSILTCKNAGNKYFQAGYKLTEIKNAKKK